jgi:clathrin heavy chain
VYESAGYKDEAMKLLEAGLQLETAHAGVFTELGVLYSRYRPEALGDHIRAYA